MYICINKNYGQNQKIHLRNGLLGDGSSNRSWICTDKYSEGSTSVRFGSHWLPISPIFSSLQEKHNIKHYYTVHNNPIYDACKTVSKDFSTAKITGLSRRLYHRPLHTYKINEEVFDRISHIT